MLVSSPATTAINVAGYVQYSGASTIADLFSSTGYYLTAMAQTDPVKRTLMKQKAQVYRSIQSQKMFNFLDPYATYDTFMAVLDVSPDAQKLLRETYSGGIQSTGKRHGISPDSETFQNLERIANAASTYTGVTIQDVYTKSQVFITELDKYIRLRSNNSKKLSDILATGALSDIDDDAIGAAIDTTLRSVYAKNYTLKGENGELITGVAQLVEDISNTPGLGTVLPFGRFLNSVVATTHQWGPTAILPATMRVAQNMIKGSKGVVSQDIAVTAMARAYVGTGALVLAAMYDRQKNPNLGMFEMEGAGGNIIDIQNTFPLSLWVAAGRVVNRKYSGEEVNVEVYTDLLNQLGVGQVTTDLQFANGLNAAVDVFLNDDPKNTQEAWDGLLKKTGNVAAGFFRPLDAVNQAVGFIADNDQAKDIRQAEGLGIITQSATKYIDNILEVFVDKIDDVLDDPTSKAIDAALTGTTLRLSTKTDNEGAIRPSANPFAKILGLKIKQKRSSAEDLYSVLNMHTWTADQRGSIDQYDRAFNTILAPILDRQAEVLLTSKDFMSKPLQVKRDIFKGMLKDLRKYVKLSVEQGFDEEGLGPLLAMQNKASNLNKSTRLAATQFMEDNGFATNIKEMNHTDLLHFFEFADYYNGGVKDYKSIVSRYLKKR